MDCVGGAYIPLQVSLQEKGRERLDGHRVRLEAETRAMGP